VQGVLSLFEHVIRRISCTFSGRSGKPQSTPRDAEKNNNPLRFSASSAVNLFCHDQLIQNKLKSLTGTLAIIHEAIKRRIIHKDFREIVNMMKKNNIWINDEILGLFDE